MEIILQYKWRGNYAFITMTCNDYVITKKFTDGTGFSGKIYSEDPLYIDISSIAGCCIELHEDNSISKLQKDIRTFKLE